MFATSLAHTIVRALATHGADELVTASEGAAALSVPTEPAHRLASLRDHVCPVVRCRRRLGAQADLEARKKLQISPDDRKGDDAVKRGDGKGGKKKGRGQQQQQQQGEPPG